MLSPKKVINKQPYLEVFTLVRVVLFARLYFDLHYNHVRHTLLWVCSEGMASEILVHLRFTGQYSLQRSSILDTK